MSFKKLNLSSALLQTIEKSGYEEPTEIQSRTIPSILMGRDVLACAQTGTGKTASFLLPIIDVLAHDRTRAGMPRCIILTPTRELAIQISTAFDTFSSFSQLKYAVLVGGSSPVTQERALAKGPDILIATPGRLLDMQERGKIMFLDVKILVLDEADRMLDMGFMPDVEKLLSLLPQKRQSLLFSATMPKEIKKFADKMLNHPNEVVIKPKDRTAKTIKQAAIQTTLRSKRKVLRDILSKEKMTQTIVFCNQKRNVSDLARSLKQYNFDAAALHGDMTQTKRNEVLDAFKKGEIRILIASNVVARGLDVDGLSHVFNFDLPSSEEDYVHRIGRTGRAGQSGTAISILTPEDKKTWLKIVQATNSTVVDYVTNAPFAFKDKEQVSKVAKAPPKEAAQDVPAEQAKNNSKPQRVKINKPPASQSQSQKGFGCTPPAFFMVDNPLLN